MTDRAKEIARWVYDALHEGSPVKREVWLYEITDMIRAYGDERERKAFEAGVDALWERYIDDPSPEDWEQRPTYDNWRQGHD